MKKKQYSNLNADGTPREATAPKKTRKKKSANPVAKAIKAKKKASVKPRLSETPTFLGLVTVNPLHYTGFVYRITLTHRLANGVRYYIGKKGFATGSAWTHYQSSSEKVMEMLEAGWVASYEILSYHRTEWELSNAERKAIAQSWLSEALRDVSVNFGIPSGSRHMSRYMYCKKYLGQIDKRH